MMLLRDFVEEAHAMVCWIDRGKGGALAGMAIAALMLGAPVAAQAGETVLHQQIWALGSEPKAGLAQDKNGVLYGTTSQGGQLAGGTVFTLTPVQGQSSSYTYNVIYNFSGGSDGWAPEAGVMVAPDGTLYGTAYGGGSNVLGTVFHLTPQKGQTLWNFTVIHAFAGKPDGSNPEAGLTMDASGALYGVTSWGGSGNNGTVFKLIPSKTNKTGWQEYIIMNFNYANGQNPLGAPVLDSRGNVYGTVNGGGASQSGLVYELMPHTSTQYVYKAIWTFTGSTDPAAPEAPLILVNDTTLYGTSNSGGIVGCGYFGCGTVFSLTTSDGAVTWHTNVLHRFTGNSDGSSPQAPLTYYNNYLYGVALAGGSKGDGTVFQLKTGGGGFTTLHSFTGNPDGTLPLGPPVFNAHGVGIGTTSGGGANADGIIYTIQ
jgi:uncharacterized repeat protein (TIGR03803 family)